MSLAKAHGRSYGFVHDLLREAGIEFRAPGGITGPCKPA
ncbi:helix-turn-helix domain-containing protein [Streptomyces sp. NPDC005386]